MCIVSRFAREPNREAGSLTDVGVAGRRRWKIWVLVAAATTVVGGCAQSGGHAGQVQSTRRPAAAAAIAVRSVPFQGIKFLLPSGWRVARPHCGPPANRTVVRGVW